MPRKPLTNSEFALRVNPEIQLLGAYKTRRIKIAVKCRSCGHRWAAYPGNLLAGRGCQKCGWRKQGVGQRLTQEEVATRFLAAGFEVIGAYNGSTTPVLTRCGTCDHEWRAYLGSIERGWGCPNCEKQRRSERHRLDSSLVAVRYSRQRLELLDLYKTGGQKLRTKCLVCGHEWRVVPYNVFKGSGCPQCHLNGGKAESRVRDLIEKLTGWPFPKTRPAWLKGRGTRALELDGYNEEHKVAFEYQGAQHYLPLFGQQSLNGLRRRDERKRKLCQYHGVFLIRVPYWRSDMDTFVRAKLIKGGLLLS